MGIVEILREAGITADALAIGKWELYGFFLVALGCWLLAELLKHKRQMEAIRSDFAVKRKKLEAKIEGQRSKRTRREKRGGK